MQKTLQLNEYLMGIYKSRYFWWHLSIADLRAKYQRTSLGLLWSIIQPLAMTLLYAFVLTSIFKQPIKETLLYVYSGFITWDLIVFASVSGSTAFLNAAPYMKQFAHPISIYPLRSSLVGLINFGLAFLGFICWTIIWQPENISITWISLPLSIFLLLLIIWPLAIICSVIGTIYRDFSQMIILLLQALWFVSPVFFSPKVFVNGGIGFLVYYNPIYHLLELIRDPFLIGEYPNISHYGVTILLMGILWSIACIVLLKFERKIIFYI